METNPHKKKQSKFRQGQDKRELLAIIYQRFGRPANCILRKNDKGWWSSKGLPNAHIGIAGTIMRELLTLQTTQTMLSRESVEFFEEITKSLKANSLSQALWELRNDLPRLIAEKGSLAEWAINRVIKARILLHQPTQLVIKNNNKDSFLVPQPDAPEYVVDAITGHRYLITELKILKENPSA